MELEVKRFAPQVRRPSSHRRPHAGERDCAAAVDIADRAKAVASLNCDLKTSRIELW